MSQHNVAWLARVKTKCFDKFTPVFATRSCVLGFRFFVTWGRSLRVTETKTKTGFFVCKEKYYRRKPTKLHENAKVRDFRWTWKSTDLTLHFRQIFGMNEFGRIAPIIATCSQNMSQQVVINPPIIQEVIILSPFHFQCSRNTRKVVWKHHFQELVTIWTFWQGKRWTIRMRELNQEA